MYKTVIFFLSDSGTPDLIPHQEYVRLVRADLSMPKYARQQVRIADWYIKMDGDRPIEVENETYGFLHFDTSGHVAWRGEAPADAAMEERSLPKNSKAQAWLPTSTERATLYEIVFQSKFLPE